ncbi:MAG: TolC family protein [Burkholderiaceae bacterium]|nr:TolC family protein [Burkholderiaceae bacterium]
MTRAVSTHPSILVRQSQIDGATAAADGARWRRFPSPSVQTERSNGQTIALMRLEQSVWTAGRISAGVEGAQARGLAAQWSLREAQHDLALRVVDAIESLMAALWRSQAVDVGLVRLQAMEGAIARRIHSEVSPRVEMDLMQSRITQLRIESLSHRSAVAVARQRLSQWIGEDIDPDVIGEAASRLVSEDKAGFSQQAVDGLLAQGLLVHPTLRRIEAEISSAQYAVKETQASAWPQVFARIERQMAVTGRNGTPAENRIYFGLSYAPGAGLSLQSQIRERLTQVQALERSREASLLDLQLRVRSEWEVFQTSAARISESRSMLTNSSDVTQSYRRLFLVGKRSWQDVLNAAREQLVVETSLADLKAQSVASAYRLQTYSGRWDWQKYGDVK